MPVSIEVVEEANELVPIERIEEIHLDEAVLERGIPSTTGSTTGVISRLNYVNNIFLDGTEHLAREKIDEGSWLGTAVFGPTGNTSLWGGPRMVSNVLKSTSFVAGLINSETDRILDAARDHIFDYMRNEYAAHANSGWWSRVTPAMDTVEWVAKGGMHDRGSGSYRRARKRGQDSHIYSSRSHKRRKRGLRYRKRNGGIGYFKGSVKRRKYMF